MPVLPLEKEGYMTIMHSVFVNDEAQEGGIIAMDNISVKQTWGDESHCAR
jgi:hypothetical protein